VKQKQGRRTQSPGQQTAEGKSAERVSQQQGGGHDRKEHGSCPAVSKSDEQQPGVKRQYEGQGAEWGDGEAHQQVETGPGQRAAKGRGCGQRIHVSE
jgi:hypothetical protein